MFYDIILSRILCSIEMFPSRNAFCIGETFYTYSQLGQSVSKIRTALQRSNYHNTIVGLVINDDLETYASILALWLEGCCYVPLHPLWPLERCVDISEQVELDFILDSSFESRDFGIQVLCTSKLAFDEYNLSPKADVSDEELAYILFTSGSTGKPKGVMLSRRNIAAFMDSFWKTGIEITEDDRCLQCFDLTFDVSVQGYLVPLTSGACCYTVPYGQIKYIYVSSLIEDHKLTFGAMAPSMLRYLRPYFEEIDATSLRYCILTAEACPLDLINDWYNCATNAEIYDFYGPTECTIYCSYYTLTRGDTNKAHNGIVSIGKPLANCVALIIDEAGNELPVGDKGELCIAGDQVTSGYWQNEEKNSNSFFFKEVNGMNLRFYHTGDLCFIDSDGDIMYSGRLDYQAKIQGFRVEMGEIEYFAREYLKGKNVICMAFDNKDSLTEIAMFIEADEVNQDELIAFLRTRIPSYMIPTRLISIPVLPLNSNDKIDKLQLKSMIKEDDK